MLEGGLACLEEALLHVVELGNGVRPGGTRAIVLRGPLIVQPRSLRLKSTTLLLALSSLALLLDEALCDKVRVQIQRA